MSGEIWEYHRREAADLAAQLTLYVRSVEIARIRGDGAMIKYFFEKKIECQKLLETANEKAANNIFKEYNQDNPTHTVDLHGLYVREAIQKLDEHIQKAKMANVEWLQVIVGQGLHSDDGPRIKPAVRQFATDKGIQLHSIGYNGGWVYLDLTNFSIEMSNNKNEKGADTSSGSEKDEKLMIFLQRAAASKIRCRQ